jgi:hypothetical protein
MPEHRHKLNPQLKAGAAQMRSRSASRSLISRVGSGFDCERSGDRACNELYRTDAEPGAQSYLRLRFQTSLVVTVRGTDVPWLPPALFWTLEAAETCRAGRRRQRRDIARRGCAERGTAACSALGPILDSGLWVSETADG